MRTFTGPFDSVAARTVLGQQGLSALFQRSVSPARPQPSSSLSQRRVPEVKVQRGKDELSVAWSAYPLPLITTRSINVFPSSGFSTIDLCRFGYPPPG